ncbi:MULTISPECIES: Asd/ArgC dimerization domain-containing protein [Roseobacteraceae]|uniref:Asd/ArgC dimerization domain-containing protein n=1 Tax=Roseobacteraceae TaxID=2854170 RepID=UPI003296D182
MSLHDQCAAQGTAQISGSRQWNVSPDVAKRLAEVPLLAPDAPALAPVLLSFLPDQGAEDIEAQHLARGTRVITHCEYARLKAPMVLPCGTPAAPQSPLLATPNCTTAMCAQVLSVLDAAHGVAGTTITTLQAISGTDLPGMPAHVIHDQVVGHLDGEATALSQELGAIFNGAFQVDAFATRVPVWRGHTITLSVGLKHAADAQTVMTTLSASPDLTLTGVPTHRDRFSPDAPVATVTNVRDGAHGVLIVIKGDNLEMATTGVMQWALHQYG